MSNPLDDWLDELPESRSKALKLLSTIRSIRPETNPETFKEFITGKIHEDYQNEVVIRIEQLRDFYEDCPNNQYLETRGGIKALRLVLDIFEVMLRNRIADLESETKERKDEKVI